MVLLAVLLESKCSTDQGTGRSGEEGKVGCLQFTSPFSVNQAGKKGVSGFTGLYLVTSFRRRKERVGRKISLNDVERNKGHLPLVES